MSDFDAEKFLNEVHYAWGFQYMIGDVEDFLDFSEANIEWQYRRELQAIDREIRSGGFPDGYKEHLETNAEHRFKVSLPLRIRYAAVVTLATSVEWSVEYLIKTLKEPISAVTEQRNKTVHALFELSSRTSLGRTNVIQDYEALVHVRNCIAHSAGIEEHYRFRNQLPAAIARLKGFSLGNQHFLGTHICIERGALNPYIRDIGQLVVDLHRATHEGGLWRDGT